MSEIACSHYINRIKSEENVLWMNNSYEPQFSPITRQSFTDHSSLCSFCSVHIIVSCGDWNTVPILNLFTTARKEILASSCIQFLFRIREHSIPKRLDIKLNKASHSNVLLIMKANIKRQNGNVYKVY